MSTATQSTTPPKSTKNTDYLQQTIQNRMLLVVLSMVVLVPFLAAPNIPGSHRLAQIAQFIMAGLLAGVLVMRTRFVQNQQELAGFFATGSNLPVLLYVIYSAIWLAIAPRNILAVSLPEFMRIFTGTLLYFALAYHIRRSEHLVKIMDALVFVAGVMAFYGLTTLLTPGADSSKLLGDKQLAGGFMMILFPITIVAAFTEQKMNRVIAAQVAAALTAIGLIMSGTRSAWIGGVVEIVVLIACSFVTPPKSRPNLLARKQQVVIPLLVIVAGSIVFAALGGTQGLLGKRLSQESIGSALEFRSKMAYAAQQMIIANPLFGHGPGSFALSQREYTGYGQPSDIILQIGPSLWENAHNFWLQVGADQGLLGISLFAAILVSFFYFGVRRLRYLEGGIRRNLLLACLAGVAGFAIDALGNPAWYYFQVAMFLWLMLGVGVACMRPRKG